MSRGVGGAVMRAFGARDHQTVVTAVESRPDGYVRVRFASETLFDDVVLGPTSWVRCWFPDERGREHQRGYTFVDADPADGTFALDFLRHSPGGPALRWAEAATPGDRLAMVSMSSVPYEIDPDDPPAGVLLIGDPASLPAIESILAAAPTHVPVELYLHLEPGAEAPRAPQDRPRLRVHRVPDTGPDSLAAALEDRDWSDWQVWAGAESAALKAVRRRLKEFGFPRAVTHVQAYWARGRQMGKARDTEAGAALGAGETVTAAQADAPVAVPARETAWAAPAAADAVGAPDRDPAESSPAAGPAPVGRARWRAAGAGRLLRPMRPVMIGAALAQTLITAGGLVPLVLLAEFARRVIAGDGADRLWPLATVAAVVAAVTAVLEAATSTGTHVADARFADRLRRRLVSTLTRLPLGWFTARTSGSITALVRDDPAALHYLITHAVRDAAAAVVAPVLVLVYLGTVDWALTLILLIPVLIYLVMMARMVTGSGPRIAQAQTWSTEMSGEAGAFLEAQPVVRVFGGPAASRFADRLDRYIAFLDDWQRPLSRAKTGMDLVTRPATFLWLIAAAGTWFVLVDRMTVADLAAFLLLGTTFGARLLGIGYGLGALSAGLVAARDVQAVLDEPGLVQPPAPEPGRGRAVRPAPPGELVFSQVTYRHRPGPATLDGIDLTLRPGTVTAVVGPSGAGKSTLAGLAARFHDVESGRITVGGHDVRTLSSDELYSRIGFVLQQPRLIRGTVAENIALAVPGADRARIEQAARAAQIHERILALPAGYDTALGPDAALSGGERQRLTIARALLADPPVLILDEATAYADPESEHRVQQALSRLADGRTVLIIAHRLHTVVDADRIVVLDGGRIVESGTHDELLAAGGRYRDLWRAAPAPAGAGGDR